MDVVPGGDHSTFVEPAQQIYDCLFGSVVVDDLEFSDVAFLLHDLEDLDYYFGDWMDDYLPFPCSLGI